MKQLIALLAATTIGLGYAQAQGFFSWGIKGGLNTVVHGKFNNFENVPTSKTETKNLIIKQNKVGWGMHIGAFARLKVAMIYIQPELLFATSKTSIAINTEDPTLGETVQTVADQKFNKFDIPIMVGGKIGPVRINLGPVATFIINEKGSFRDRVNEIAGQTITERFKGATFGYQVGVGVDVLNRVGFDLRFEGGLNKFGEKITIGSREYKTDQRNSQLILSACVYL